MPVNTGSFLLCSFLQFNMSISYDFQIISTTDVPGLSLVMPMNEDAFSYLEDEQMTILPNGSSPIDTDCVGDFINDAEWAHLCTAYV